MSTRGERRRRDRAFARDVEPVLSALYDFAGTLARGPEADDLVQSACLRALEHYAEFAARTNFKAWIFTILKNEFLTRTRSERRRREIREEMAIPLELSPVDDLEDMLIEQRWGIEIRDALLALPESFRTPVYLKDVAGFAYREIAEIDDCALGTVMSRLSRGRALLRTALTRQARERGLLGGGGAARIAQ